MSAYGCQVYAFDPSMAGQDHYDHYPGHVHFYKWGLGDLWWASRDQTSRLLNRQVTHYASQVFNRLYISHLIRPGLNQIYNS
jgi:hypothetical protein